MGYIGYGGEFTPHQTDIGMFSLVKLRIDGGRDCYGCGSRISKGDYCFGTSWTRFCLKCAKNMMENAKEGYDDLRRKAERGLTILERDYEKLNTENMANKI